MDPIQQEIKYIWDAIKELQRAPDLVDHEHNGNDASRVNWVNIYQKRLYVHHTIQGTAAATGANYSTFYIVPVACYINSFKEVHVTAGTDGGAVTLQLEKLTGTTAPGSGSTILSTALSLKATINTVQTGTLVTTAATRTFAVGDRLALKSSGTLTAVANVSVIAELIVL